LANIPVVAVAEILSNKNTFEYLSLLYKPKEVAVMNSEKKKTFSRREFLRYSGLAASAAILAGCGAASGASTA
jgi:hypothetical protein